jgi:hypothetical protein
MKPAYFLLATVLLTSLFTASAKDSEGVPDMPIDYSLTADAWWEQHPLNPAAPGGAVQIVSPKTTVEVSAAQPSIQKAIDSLPASGGTIRLVEGSYAGGFEILNRANIHLVGHGRVIIRGAENFVIGSALNHDYGAFNKAAFDKNPAAMATLRELPAHNIYFKNITFEQSPVRLASCRSVLFDDCIFLQPENRNEGDVDAAGKKVQRWGRPLPVTGIMGLRGIWFRGCEFQGQHANAYYLDGAQGSGAIRCRFAGGDRFWNNAILLFTNDDCSLDVTGDGKLEPWERRDIRYYVVDGCRFGGGYKRGAIAASGRDVLAQNCVVEGKLDSFMVMNAKTSGKPIQHECFGVIARNNQLDNVNAIITAEGASNRPAKGIPASWVWTKYEIGRFTILNNRTGPGTKPLREIPNDSQILGPHRIEGNGPGTSTPKP